MTVGDAGKDCHAWENALASKAGNLFASARHGGCTRARMDVPHSAATLNEITSRIIAAAIEVHSVLGPGLFEKTYVRCLCFELSQRGVAWQAHVTLPLVYKTLREEQAYQIDLLVER